MEQDFLERRLERSGFPLLGAGKRTYVTWTLLAVNAFILLITELAGGSDNPEVLVDFGAMFGPLIAEGEYWRLFTAMFLHVGLMHFLVNGFVLLIFGRLVESTFGHIRFIIIYLLAGLSGSVASYLFNSIAIGAGASGAIFGVMGALAAFYLVRRNVLGEMGRQNFSGLLVLAGINLLFGLLTPGIDNWAHMGGFAGGFAIGLAFAPAIRYRMVVTPIGASGRLVFSNSDIKGWWVLPVVVAVIVMGTLLGNAKLADNPLSRTLKAESLMEQKEYALALDEISQALEEDPFLAEAYYLRGRVLAELGESNPAISELSRAIRLGLDWESRIDAVALITTLSSRR